MYTAVEGVLENVPRVRPFVSGTMKYTQATPIRVTMPKNVCVVLVQ